MAVIRRTGKGTSRVLLARNGFTRAPDITHGITGWLTEVLPVH